MKQQDTLQLQERASNAIKAMEAEMKELKAGKAIIHTIVDVSSTFCYRGGKAT